MASIVASHTPGADMHEKQHIHLPGVSALKRSDAKFHKRNPAGPDHGSARSLSCLPRVPSGPALLDESSNVLKKRIGESSKLASRNEYVSVPYGMYGFTKVPRPPKELNAKGSRSKNVFSYLGGRTKTSGEAESGHSDDRVPQISSHIVNADSFLDTVISTLGKDSSRTPSSSAVHLGATDNFVDDIPSVGQKGDQQFRMNKGKSRALQVKYWSDFDRDQVLEHLAVVDDLGRKQAGGSIDSGIDGMNVDTDDMPALHDMSFDECVAGPSSPASPLMLDTTRTFAAIQPVSRAGKGQGYRWPEWVGRHFTQETLPKEGLPPRESEFDILTALELRRIEAEYHAAESVRLRECLCCGDEKLKLDFPASPPTSTCTHTSQTCTDCLASWMSVEFDTKGCDDIKCPECPSKLSFDDIKRAASAATFDAYERMLTRTALSALDDFAWCLAPKCSSGQLNVASDNYMDCANCGFKQCLRHKCAWHVGETCKAYEYRTSGLKARDDERATEAMLEADKSIKLCPGENCGWRIQKLDGCDHMRCKRCKFEFCWECLASHVEIKQVGNTAHQEWCKFHSQNLDLTWPFSVHR
jgi:hypothetical protein